MCKSGVYDLLSLTVQWVMASFAIDNSRFVSLPRQQAIYDSKISDLLKWLNRIIYATQYIGYRYWCHGIRLHFVRQYLAASELCSRLLLLQFIAEAIKKFNIWQLEKQHIPYWLPSYTFCRLIHPADYNANRACRYCRLQQRLTQPVILTAM